MKRFGKNYQSLNQYPYPYTINPPKKMNIIINGIIEIKIKYHNIIKNTINIIKNIEKNIMKIIKNTIKNTIKKTKMEYQNVVKNIVKIIKIK